MEYKYKVKVGEFSLELAGDKEFIRQEREIFFQHLAQLKDKDTPLDTADTPSLTPEEQIKKFVYEKGYDTVEDTTLGLAYFLHAEKSQPVFTADDVHQVYKDGCMVVPEDLEDILRRQVTRRHIQPTDDAKKSYQLTDTGLYYLENFQQLFNR